MFFRDVEYVTAISRYQSITKAAEQLYITQPTLSIYLKKMEQRLGVQLFERVGKRLVLTYAGRCFVEEGTKILEMRDNLEKRLKDIAQNDSGELKVGISTLCGTSFLSAVLPKFSQIHPNVAVVLQEEETPRLESQLAAGDLDLAVFSDWTATAPSLSSVPIWTGEVVLCAWDTHPLIKDAVSREGFKYPWIDISECRDNPFLMITPDHPSAFGSCNMIFQDAGFDPIVRLSLRSIGSAINLAAQGYGLCLAPELHANLKANYARDPFIFSTGRRPLYSNLAVAYRTEARQAGYSRNFVSIVQEVYQSDPAYATS